MTSPRPMLRAVRSLFAALAFVCAAFALSQPAHAQMEPGPGQGWLTIASRTKPGDAIAMAQGYSRQFPTAVVFQGSNGFFAVSLGWMNIGEGQALLGDLVSRGAIPADSYFTGGSRFVRAIWAANGSHAYDQGRLFASTRLAHAGRSVEPAPQERVPPATVQAAGGQRGSVGNLAGLGDNFLSLRSGPGSGFKEIARMREGTAMSVTGTRGGWFEVRLDNGMRGWAFGKYLVLQDGRSQQAAAPEEKVPVIGPDKPVPAEPAPQEKQETATTEPAGQDKPAQAVTKLEPAKPLAGQKRVALVLGNSKYLHTTELANPKNDAAAMTGKLSELGFEVISSLDGSKTDMERAVRDFVKALPGSDVALFFYAGHAMQVNGRNFLIPVDAKLEDSTAIDFETIDLQVVLDFMNEKDRISIALVDACRDNPLSRRFARNFSASRSGFIGRGLAAPATEGGEMLIGFATAPGKVALDGDGDNSPFTTALLRHIGSPGVDVEVMLKAVKRDVYELTNAEQEPWHNSALRREFHFNPAQ